MEAKSPLEGLRRLISAMTLRSLRMDDGPPRAAPGITSGSSVCGALLQFREGHEASAGLHVLLDSNNDVIKNGHD